MFYSVKKLNKKYKKNNVCKTWNINLILFVFRYNHLDIVEKCKLYN